MLRHASPAGWPTHWLATAALVGSGAARYLPAWCVPKGSREAALSSTLSSRGLPRLDLPTCMTLGTAAGCAAALLRGRTRLRLGCCCCSDCCCCGCCEAYPPADRALEGLGKTGIMSASRRGGLRLRCGRAMPAGAGAGVGTTVASGAAAPRGAEAAAPAPRARLAVRRRSGSQSEAAAASSSSSSEFCGGGRRWRGRARGCRGRRRRGAGFSSPSSDEDSAGGRQRRKQEGEVGATHARGNVTHHPT